LERVEEAGGQERPRRRASRDRIYPAALRQREQDRGLTAEELRRAHLRAKILHQIDDSYLKTYEDHLRAVEAHLFKTLRRTGHPVTRRSGNKRYTFWRHEKGDRLLVKVGWLGGRKSRRERPVQPFVEELAARLRGRGACRLCGAWFDRNGTRKKFCTPEHAAKFRKQTWRQRRAQDARDATGADESARLIERNEALRRASERTARALNRRRQRARKKRRAALLNAGTGAGAGTNG
jgi:hypothetical protein